jgi:transcriptional regulator with XRE-family HTH domain
MLLDRSSKSDSSIADDLDVSRQAISMWRSGERSPKKPTIEKIANYFGVDIAWLMGYESNYERSDALRRNASIILGGFDRADIDAARYNGVEISLVERTIESNGPITLDRAKEVAEILGVSIDELTVLDKEYEEDQPEIGLAKEFITLFSSLPPEDRRIVLGELRVLSARQQSASDPQ